MITQSEARRAVKALVDHLDSSHNPLERQSWERLATLAGKAQETCRAVGGSYHQLLQQALAARRLVAPQ